MKQYIRVQIEVLDDNASCCGERCPWADPRNARCNQFNESLQDHKHLPAYERCPACLKAEVKP